MIFLGWYIHNSSFLNEFVYINDVTKVLRIWWRIKSTIWVERKYYTLTIVITLMSIKSRARQFIFTSAILTSLDNIIWGISPLFQEQYWWKQQPPKISFKINFNNFWMQHGPDLDQQMQNFKAWHKTHIFYAKFGQYVSV